MPVAGCRSPVSCCLLLLLLLLPASASANGRFPATTSVSFPEGDSNRIFLGTTFGLLISADDGETWGWVCEMAVLYGGMYDPVFAATASGLMMATTITGLAMSRDGGCTWERAGTPLADYHIADLTIASDGAIWTMTATGGRSNDVYVSRDDGATFVSAGLASDAIYWRTIRVAPSDQQRIYASGYQVLAGPGPDGGANTQPVLKRSIDGGVKWRDIPAPAPSDQLFLLGVLPGNPDVLFARVDGAPEDALYRWDDAAGFWALVLAFGENLTGFAILPDGTVVAGTEYAGVQVSHDGGLTFARAAASPRMSCAGARADGALFSCGSNWEPDFFALGRSGADPAQAWAPTLRFSQIDGMLACPAGTPAADMCAVLWPDLVSRFGIGMIPVPDAGVTPPPKKGGCGCDVSVAWVLLWFPARLRSRHRF